MTWGTKSDCRIPAPLLAVLGLGLLASACAANVATPPGFVVLSEDSAYDYRATTADGLVIAARRIDNDPPGELSFWERAIENEMRFRGGYALLESRDVRTRGGLRGRQLRFGHDESREPHLYYVTLFIGEEHSLWVFGSSKIYILEAGGPAPLVQARAADIEQAVREFDPADL